MNRSSRDAEGWQTDRNAKLAAMRCDAMVLGGTSLDGTGRKGMNLA